METNRSCFSGGIIGPEEAAERQREWEEVAEA
jgi:hypothetical protein